ncbi:ADP-ribosylglycohydrolase family protein [Feifania hominis]|uniref:ADP-ribosylglycohydrolase family protein n=1 Tax=Feifania hominis TaxID=2763660 RepID=A0A926DDF7_9FIRM|nr:ADP-ribosylglycohydrolase family protein [Feifania hominis]MBC8536935.1 ADP-ribosylglycohydrolase family protein [Feifania hominis]
MKHFAQKDPFGSYVARIYYEWCQARDEGRRVEELEELCRAMQESFSLDDPAPAAGYRELAAAVGRYLTAAPVYDDYPYSEPSDYGEIAAQSPGGAEKPALPPRGELRDRVAGAWTGRVAGCLLGKPLEFMKRSAVCGVLRETGNYPVTRYVSSAEFTPEMRRRLRLKTGVPEQPWIDEIGDFAPIDDDTNYTVLNLKLLLTFGRDFAPNDVLYAWLNWMPAGIVATAERVAYQNAANGILYPESAVHQNPYREWVGAQIRAEVFGMVNPCDPHAAAEMAWRDACISHTRNGIYGEMFTAALVALAMGGGSVRELIEGALREIPAHSRFAECVQTVLGWYDEGLSMEQAADRIHKTYDENNLYDWCHILPNAMIVTAALLYGEGSFEQALHCAMLPAFDTDSNGAVVGAVMGAMLGERRIPAYWGETFHRRMASSVSGYELMEIDELAERTMAVIEGNFTPDEKIRKRYDYTEEFD